MQLIDYHGYVLNFFQMVEVVTKLGYTIEDALDDEGFNNLLNSMWLILSLRPSDYHEPGVTERNLVVFLQAIENIYLDNMICSYPLVNKDQRAFGFLINEFYYIEKPEDVRRLHLSFLGFYN